MAPVKKKARLVKAETSVTIKLSKLNTATTKLPRLAKYAEKPTRKVKTISKPPI
jgi:hypothetical protein